MTKMERLVTLGGLFTTFFAFLMAFELFGRWVASLTLFAGFALVVIGKLYCWKHTAYDGSLNNPVWVSTKEDDT